ncbi:phosphatase PAP2 family protein [Maribrevibacterium harenarium]|uniref:undecaprenyl-diphosphate phosphatase n=1 Tax=Maribrevibacterium harenarium TaxID=2589817 RepID=A0A501WG22_9GAMM|nr:phosphatase PAP2 family protein [Maribrevibacterium harenarium]TPE47752.1 phosphatase PAP2 family protein [Maribrevibacterium harenarium]
MNLLTSIHNIDVQAFYWFMARKHRVAMTRLSRIVSRTADGPLYLVIAGIFIWQGQSQWAWVLAFGFTVERVLYFILKKGFKRNRPADILDGYTSVIRPSDQFSFPSGHTSGAFFMAFCLSEWFPGMQPALYLWATQVGCSRIFLGVHFPTDTMMGAVLGSSCALLAFEVLA